MAIILRKGIEQDVPQALELVRELAVFEKAAQEVEVTVDEMTSWGFGQDKQFDFFVLKKESKIVGLAIYYYKYSTWKGKCLFLEDIVVTEKERKNGYGKMLFNAVIKVAKQEKVKRMEWQVLDWNEPAIGFYKKYNSNLDEEWINCKLSFDQLQSFDDRNKVLK
jgi:GNAT superfamily N-acetyltransferase